MSIVKNKN